MKNKLSLIIVILIIGFGCTENTPKEQTATKTQKQVEKVDKSNSELKPVSIFKDGLSAKQAQEYRNKYRSSSFITADNAGAYGFLNLTEVANTGTIFRDGQVALLEEEINLDILETMTYTNAGDKTFRELLNDEQARMQGVLIIHGGKIVFEKYMGMSRLDKHVWFSASKSLTGLLVHILEEEGLIDLNKNVTHYIPEFSSEDWQKVKVEHLLHHVSGIDYVETNKNFKLLDIRWQLGLHMRLQPVLNHLKNHFLI